MKNTILNLAILVAAMAFSNAIAMNKVYDEASLQKAIAAANADSSIGKIVFKREAHISLSVPVIYDGSQALKLIGNGATIDGSAVGSFELDSDLTEDGTLVFNTASDITIRSLTVENSATHGIVVNIPNDAQGDNISVTLRKVFVVNSALYGLHIDDSDPDGEQGSAIGVDLKIFQSEFIGNGIGASDFDGIRVDERSEGDINAVIINTHIDGNGGDGIELDEAGSGNVNATMSDVTLNDNGFFDEEDWEDGFDIDEADTGNIEAILVEVKANNNMNEGLDFDEEGEGIIKLKLHRVRAFNNSDEGIKIDEEDAGDIKAKLINVKVMDGGNDGIQFTEIGKGEIGVSLKKVTANDNAKYGIKIEQWFVEDEPSPVEEPGLVKTKKVSLSGNGEGDEIKTNNVIVE
jgi:hypothetical protein